MAERSVLADELQSCREGHWDPRKPRHVWAAFRRVLALSLLHRATDLSDWIYPWALGRRPPRPWRGKDGHG